MNRTTLFTLHPSAFILLQTAQAAAQQPHVAQVLVAGRRVLPVLLPHRPFVDDDAAVCGGGEAAEILQIQRPLVDEDRLRGFGQVEKRHPPQRAGAGFLSVSIRRQPGAGGLRRGL